MPRETREKILERERQVWALRKRGWEHERIAVKLKLARSTVTRILIRLNDRYRADLGTDVGDHHLESQARNEFFLSEALDAWDSSKVVQLKTRKRSSSRKGKTAGEEKRGEMEEIQITRDPDPRFLKLAMLAQHRIDELTGVADRIQSRQEKGPYDPEDEMGEDELWRLAQQERERAQRKV